MSRSGVVAAVTVAFLAMAGCAGPRVDVDVEPGQYGDVMTDLPADTGLAEASVWIGAEMVAAVLEEDPDANVVISPLSLQLALAVLREGATGDAVAQLDAVLGGGDVDAAVAALRARMAVFEGDVSTIDRNDPPERPLVHIADGVFVQTGFPVAPEFSRRAAENHGAEVAEVDYGSGEAKAVLDAWADRETGGLIREVPFAPDPGTVVTLLNAVVFGAQWQQQFIADFTQDGPFTLADGTVVQVETMRQETHARYSEGDRWRAIELPYREGFAMRVVQHDGDAFDTDEWREVASELGAAPVVGVDLELPTWETTVTVDLMELLVGLGLDAVFSGGGLDGIFDGAAVTGAAQSATITVAEKGTVAAAITQLEIVVSAPLPPEVELHVDSPFEYQVYDTTTGLVLFAGRVADPSA